MRAEALSDVTSGSAFSIEVVTELIGHLRDALFVVDLERGRFLGVNPAALSLLRCGKKRLLEQQLDRVFPALEDELRSPHRGRGPRLIESAPAVAANGDDLEIALTALPVDPETRRIFVLLADPKGAAGEPRGREEGLIETIVDFPTIVGRSDQIRDVCRLVGLVAKTDTTVLVGGESGTGKEVVAQAIHFHSRRSRGPLVKVNCSALTDSLLESELFGHRKGAFTGAVQDRKGRFKLADGGTIILDEIGAMSLAGQAKLLRVLQEGEFEPVGSSRTMQVDVRAIAITNSDLRAEIEAGRFREDLFYRLSAFPIRLAPLRERKVDVPLLARHFLERYSSSLRKDVRSISSTAISKLTSYSWPGNVRELENTIEYALILEEGREISTASLPDKFRRQKTVQRTLRQRLDRAERKFILEALSKTDGVKSRAARLLGMDRRNLPYFLNKHRIDWQGHWGRDTR